MSRNLQPTMLVNCKAILVKIIHLSAQIILTAVLQFWIIRRRLLQAKGLQPVSVRVLAPEQLKGPVAQLLPGQMVVPLLLLLLLLLVELFSRQVLLKTLMM